MVDGEEPALTLRLRSPDGEEGYPGNLNVAVTFSVSADNALSVHYIAETDKATPINLTNHAYFNLGGFASGNVDIQGIVHSAVQFKPSARDAIAETPHCRAQIAVCTGVYVRRLKAAEHIGQASRAVGCQNADHGFASGNVLDQVLWLDAESYLHTASRAAATGDRRAPSR